jgi:3D (Asp-Asp-Asp) domain-containing protein
MSNVEYNILLKKNSNPVEVVTLTIYSTNSGETDATPYLTASGFKIDPNNPGKHKIIAISRDLKQKWKFNTRVRIINAGRYNGIYTVKDLMNKRYKKRIDILVNNNRKPIKLTGIKVIKLYP